MESVPFDELDSADLVVDRTYRGGTSGTIADDPVAKLLPVGNSGGFRYKGSVARGTVQCLVLYTSMADPDWPDRLDLSTGSFTYYGDNKKPGRELHDTARQGNLLLKQIFADSASNECRRRVPPIFLFVHTGIGRDVMFRGLLVPGTPSVVADEQLVAIWRSAGGHRFQNYRATFSVLDTRTVSRAWLDQIFVDGAAGDLAPPEWLIWRDTGIAETLRAPRSVEFRTPEEQLPRGTRDVQLLQAVRDHFAQRPHDFEHCAAQLWMMLAPATDELIVTRPSRDGGRDAIGQYRLGPPAEQIKIDFALEAKCYAPHHSVGVRDLSRLISRLRHRNFGVLVTTSFVSQQAYKELREDQHPVVIVCGADIVDLLKSHGLGSLRELRRWLDVQFPSSAGAGASIEIAVDPETYGHSGRSSERALGA